MWSKVWILLISAIEIIVIPAMKAVLVILGAVYHQSGRFRIGECVFLSFCMHLFLLFTLSLNEFGSEFVFAADQSVKGNYKAIKPVRETDLQCHYDFILIN